ncbi:hypothetical protein LSH36_186g00056 [Paralvinella palmiformis]|uniref:Fucosyltransferase n=1 Tax=Paralvinella palmiformis TaxID=53620 RepID=A0AAD9N5N7_9ANNE|nr:hypothetical protein LSH36_186g00056 [Paralvinella palmiformis]
MKSHTCHTNAVYDASSDDGVKYLAGYVPQLNPTNAGQTNRIKTGYALLPESVPLFDMRKRFVVLWITCTVGALLVWRLFDFRLYFKDSRQSATIGVDDTSAPTKTKTRLKRILYWNAYFKSKDFKFGLGRAPFLEHQCRVTSCTVTNDKSTLSDADVVMFHGPQIDSLPDVRYRRQLYVYVQKEPWMAMSDRLMPAYGDVMNLTMTYRRDSDVVLPYAIVRRRNASDDRIRPVDPDRKSRSVVWAVSHCQTDSRRELYVDELKKHIDVDVYGDCGQLSCDKRHNRACWEMFAERYRFVVAMENDICRDYVTEKTYRPMAHDLIPIVLGGAAYAVVTPPHSVIDVADYPNPKRLAEYLRYLTGNATAYNEYFQGEVGRLRDRILPEGGHRSVFLSALRTVARRQLPADELRRSARMVGRRRLRRWRYDPNDVSLVDLYSLGALRCWS